MPSLADDKTLRARVALFIALASALTVAETMIPLPAPWLRLGLGNAFALAALVLWGVRAGAYVSLGKVLVGGLIAGRIFMPGFFLALGGSLASLIAMALAMRLPLGFVGVSVIGAAAHAAAQLILAEKLIIGSEAVWALGPMLGTLAVIAGIATGMVAAWLCGVIQKKNRAQLPTAGL